MFRFETFGNEAFWTNAMCLKQGIVVGSLTPVGALTVGLSVDIDTLDTATYAAVMLTRDGGKFYRSCTTLIRRNRASH